MTSRRVRPGLALLVGLCAAIPLAATETDQFLAWKAEIPDSGPALNRFVNEELEALLGELSPGLACEEVPPAFFRRLFPSMVRPRIRRELLRRDETVGRHPPEEVGYFDYLQASIFRRPAFPFLLPMARTWQIGEIRLGGDKIGHMLGHGRHYYARYLRARERGAEAKEAMLAAVDWGIAMESRFVGGWVDGVFSHGDLEANFQGLLLAISFCEGPSPRIERHGLRWRLVRQIDLRDYVNPGMDESWNNSTLRKSRWKDVEPILREEYCPLLDDPRVAGRFATYRRTDEPSLSRRHIRSVYQAQGRHLQEHQAIETICRSDPGPVPADGRQAEAPGERPDGTDETPPRCPRRDPC